MHSPSLPELHAFAWAARLGSYSQAAAQLQVTQGAISRAIARLQEHLGLQLFERAGRHCVLTHAGAEYLQAVAPSIDAIESATRAVRERRKPRQLRLSVAPTLFSHWLIPRMPDFAAHHPGIGLTFAPYQRNDPLTDPDVDAWICVGRPAWPDGIATDYLVGRELVPICHPAVQPSIHQPANLLTQPLLFHTHYPDNWRHWFAGVGCAHGPLAPAADFELVSLLVQAVMAGMGVAVVQRALVEPEIAAGRIAIAVDQPVLLERGYHLCLPTGRAPQPALQELRTWLLAQAGAGRQGLGA